MLISASDWDRDPSRPLLVGLLAGRLSIFGDTALGRELALLSRVGLCVHEPDLESPRPSWISYLERAWRVTPTPAGHVLGLRLADSSDLVIIARTMPPAPWRVRPSQVCAELDRRAGGDGDVVDPFAWWQSRDVQTLLDLPRRDDVHPRGAN